MTRQLLRPRYLLWLVVPFLFVWVLRGVSLGDVWATLSKLGPAQLLALALANVLVLITLSGRWWSILRAQRHPASYPSLVGYRLAAFGVSYFTPGSQFGGEPLQVYLLQRHHQVPRATAIAAVALDKSLELLANFAFLTGGVICILQCRVSPGLVARPAMLFVIALLAVPAGLLLALWAGRRPVSGLLRATSRLVPQRWVPRQGRASDHPGIHQAIQASEDQATRLVREHPRAIGAALGFSLISWAAILGEYWLALYFLGQSLTLAQAISALTAARIAFLLPVPGGLGALEASQVLALSAMGMDPAVGLSLSLLIHVRDVALGGLGLWWGGLKSELL